MNKLNNVQKILIFSAVLIFLLVNGYTLFTLYPKIQANFTPEVFPLKVTTIKDQDKFQVDYYYLTDNIPQISGRFYIEVKNNYIIYGNAPVSFSFTEKEELKLTSGLVYIVFKTSSPIIINGNPILIDAGTKILFNAKDQSIFFVEGKKEFGPTLVADKNSLIISEENKISLIKFSRSTIKTDAQYIKLLNTLEYFKVSPIEFSDLTPPEIKINSNQSYETQSESIVLKGTTEKNAIVKINGQLVNLNSNGEFSENKKLDFGSNIFTIEATDTFGNSKSLEISFKRIKTNIVPVSYTN